MGKTVKKFAYLILTLLAAALLASAAPAQEGKKICLTMIVKNESRIIERLLESVKDVVDCVSICDTGSQDNTVELIERFLKKNAIPGKVHKEQWRNFGYNRTLSVQLAQKTLRDFAFQLDQTYLLLLDADMILQVESDFTKQDLQADSYLVIQENPYISYYNTRLVRASLPWECVGVTHEYWSCNIAGQTEQLHTLFIDDREDGGCKDDKLERDIRLLTQGIKDEPNNARYHFYLAQSYKDSKNYEEAIKWYRKRIEMGGWYEEVWYSKLSLGDLYVAKDDWNQALQWYLDAYESNPARAEPLHRIARYYRLHGQKQLAYMFAKQGSKIPYPENQVLFISYPVYDYQFDEELSITADQTQFKDDGYAAINRLLLKKCVPKITKEYTYNNLKFYIKSLPDAEFQKISRSALAEPEGHANNAVPFFKDSPLHAFDHFQGSTALLAFDEGYLMLVHEVIPDTQPYHAHRFVYLDSAHEVHKISKPFIFQRRGFEYCSEMTIDEKSNRLALPIGIDEIEAYRCLISLDTVRSLLEPLP